MIVVACHHHSVPMGERTEKSVDLRHLGFGSAVGPSKDKPGITFAAPTSPEKVAGELVLRVPDCQSAYDALRNRGASFLTPPVKQDWGGEIRCFFRDPDGHLIEVSELLGEG